MELILELILALLFTPVIVVVFFYLARWYLTWAFKVAVYLLGLDKK